MCEKQVEGLGLSDRVFVSSWESFQDRFVSFPFVAKHFRRQFNELDDLRSVQLVYVCGSDHYVQKGAPLAPTRVLARHGSIVPQGKKNFRIVQLDEDLSSVRHENATEYEVGEVPACQVSSTLVRKRILAGRPIEDLVGQDVERMVRTGEVLMRVSEADIEELWEPLDGFLPTND